MLHMMFMLSMLLLKYCWQSNRSSQCYIGHTYELGYSKIVPLHITHHVLQWSKAIDSKIGGSFYLKDQPLNSLDTSALDLGFFALIWCMQWCMELLPILTHPLSMSNQHLPYMICTCLTGSGWPIKWCRMSSRVR
jgi:hypothetical protein